MFFFGKKTKQLKPLPSVMLDPKRVDFVALDQKKDRVVLSMIESRPWGEHGENLPYLEAKLNSYLDYVESGRLVKDFPVTAGKRVTFQLQSASPLGDREEAFILLVKEKYLDVRGINWETSIL